MGTFLSEPQRPKANGLPLLGVLHTVTQYTAELEDRARWPGFVLCSALATLAEAAQLRTPGARYCICTQRIIFTKIMRSMQGQYFRVSNDVSGGRGT